MRRYNSILYNKPRSYAKNKTHTGLVLFFVFYGCVYMVCLIEMVDHVTLIILEEFDISGDQCDG